VEHSEPTSRRTVHPVLFLVLYLPFAAPAGYLAAAVERTYTDAGVGVVAFGALIAISNMPQVAKMFWAPLIDTTLSVKAWFLVGAALVAPSYVITGLLPVGARSIPALTVLAVVASFAATFMGMACESLMAHATPPERLGQAAGWSQAGNVGGTALGGAAGLFLVDSLHSLLTAGWVMALLSALCSVALLFAPPSTRHPRHPTYLETLKVVGRDCWQVCRSRAGLLVLFLLLLPLGEGAASGLFAGVSRDWGVSPKMLAGINALSALCIGAAALAGGFICDRVDRKTAYLAFGLAEGLIAAGMALAPRTPGWFLAFDLAYAASAGIAYAGFAAVVLESIGRGAAATKFNLFAGVANVPVVIMPAADGWAAGRWGPSGMLWVEFATAAAAVALFVAVSAVTRTRPAPAAVLEGVSDAGGGP
jgi:MFS family permease